MKKHLLAVVFLLAAMVAVAQKGSVKGFVVDQTNGEAVPYASVRLDNTDMGAATDDKGFFNIPNIPEGTYTLIVSFIGYKQHSDTINIVKGKTINLKVQISQIDNELAGVEISAEKQKQRTETRVSVVSVTPQEMRRLPTIGGEADVAQYLQVIPGVVSTGDQGGQVVIRGGTPIQTKFLLDGITVYNPFHSIGLFSIYETDIIKNVDVYTGGFPAQYGGRVSAVVDVTTRDGNQKKFSGKVGASPFMAHALLEIPIVKLKEDRNISSSLILNTKVSYLDRTSKALYPYAGKSGLPFSFYDVYGKFTLNAGKTAKMNITGFNYRDMAALGTSNFLWNNFGIGANFLAVPKNSNISFNTHVSYSKYDIKLSGADNQPRNSSIQNADIGMDFISYIKRGELKYGLNVEIGRTEYAFTNQLGIRYAQDQSITDMSAYVTAHKYMKKFVIEAGAHLHYYGNIGAVSPEPRLSIKYNVHDMVRLKLASGMYSQNLISTKSDRDIVNLFTGFLTGTDDVAVDASGKEYDKIKNMQRSVHAIFGIELEFPKNVTVNIEPYYKYFWNMLNINRYKQFNNDPNFLIEKGEAYGLDIMTKWEYKGIYLYATYSLSWTNRKDGLQVYYPHFDRRHNVNLLASYNFGKKRTWEVSARWNFGTGFPFTQTQAIYEGVNFTDNGLSTDYTTNNGNVNILYDDKINGGRLPVYHRLDISAKKIFNIKDVLKIELNVSVSNVYNRQNIFYIDRLSYTRINQLPILPSLGVAFSW